MLLSQLENANILKRRGVFYRKKKERSNVALLLGMEITQHSDQVVIERFCFSLSIIGQVSSINGQTLIQKV